MSITAYLCPIGSVILIRAGYILLTVCKGLFVFKVSMADCRFTFTGSYEHVKFSQKKLCSVRYHMKKLFSNDNGRHKTCLLYFRCKQLLFFLRKINCFLKSLFEFWHIRKCLVSRSSSLEVRVETVHLPFEKYCTCRCTSHLIKSPREQSGKFQDWFEYHKQHNCR